MRNKKTYRKPTKTELKVIKLLEKIDELSKEKDFNAYLFGNTRRALYLVLSPFNDNKKESEQLNLIRDIELSGKVGLVDLAFETCPWIAESIVGDGGDCDAGWAFE